MEILEIQYTVLKEAGVILFYSLSANLIKN